MTWNCLVVDLLGNSDQRAEEAKASALQFSLELNFASGIEEAAIFFNTGSVVAMIVFADRFEVELETLLRMFQDKAGCLPESQLIVVEEPAPRFIVSVFEFGIEQFVSPSGWVADAVELCERIRGALNDKESAEARNLELTNAIRAGDQARILDIGTEIKEVAATDYRAAFARGRALEAVGAYNDALGEYSSASRLNKMFRPSDTSRGQTLLLTGKIDEAIEVFQKLERTNPRDLNRKANLASAYVEKGDIEKAKQYLAEGQALAPDHPRLIETKAQICLGMGKIGEAFQLMDQMSEVGPFFAAKLNELGIKLSQAGKGKSALALYQKAHRIVRSELKYKISLNAALACRRLKEYEMALKYVARCRKEYGGSFEKLDKIEEGIRATIAKEKADLAKKAG